MQRFLHVLRRAARLGSDGHRRRRDVAQQPDGHLAVEKDVLDELHDLRVARIDRQADQRRIPDAPDLAALVRQALRIVWIRLERGRRRWALRQRAQPCAAGALAAADHVQLIVEDEQVARRCRTARRPTGSNISTRSTSKNRPNTSFMATKAAAMPPVPARNRRRSIDSFLLADSGEFRDSRFDLRLLVGLQRRHVLAVRDHPRGHGRWE